MGKYNLKLDGAEIDEITLNRHGDKLEISADDATIFDRFADGYDKLVKMAEEMPDKLDVVEKESAEKESEEKGSSDIAKTVAISKVRVAFCEEAVGIIDGIFGAGTVKKSFRDTYESIPDFLPDEDMFLMFFEKMTPIMEDIFNRKLDRQKKAGRERMAKYQTQDHKKPQRKGAK